MRMNVTWRDRRVEYLNLRNDIYQNLVPDDEVANIWIPEIGFYNAKTGRLDKDEHFEMNSHVNQGSNYLQENYVCNFYAR